MNTIDAAVEARARQSLGRAHGRIHALVASLLAARNAGGTLVDVGCGTGDRWRATADRFTRCIGIDAVRYPELPREIQFEQADLDRDRLPLADAAGDATAAVEVVEHLENPRGFVRELVRVTRPGGWVVMTTHARGPMGRFWLGSVTDELVRTLPIPLVAVHPSEKEPDLIIDKPVKHILIPLDGTPLR